jgi:hypothetical protein
MTPAPNDDLEQYLSDARRLIAIPRPHAPEMRDEEAQQDFATELWDYLGDFA